MTTNYMKNIKNLLEQYDVKINVPVKQNKLHKDDIYIPQIKEYQLLLINNYSIPQLKLIAAKYNLPVGGKKEELMLRIYKYFYFTFHATRIQGQIRRYFIQKIFRLYGPAFKNRSLCVNKTDCCSMEDIEEIPSFNFFSFKDDDGFIYGFDMISISELIKNTSGQELKNPYNFNKFNSNALTNYLTIINLAPVYKINLNLELVNDLSNLGEEKKTELRVLKLFQAIDALGNYSQQKWFMDLDINKLNKFMHELLDVWTYRAQLTEETKKAVCPPLGNPFASYIGYSNNKSLDKLRNSVLDILERFVNSGINKDSKCLGASYVLGCLTLVNNNAASSLPWLYDSFFHI
jgi:hypothetical protein